MTDFTFIKRPRDLHLTLSCDWLVKLNNWNEISTSLGLTNNHNGGENKFKKYTDISVFKRYRVFLKTNVIIFVHVVLTNNILFV